MTDTTLQIPGMHCGGCARTVSLTVRLLPGIETVAADFKTRTARVRFDASEVSLETIQQALAEIGYEAEPEETAPA